jgi:hypothetical protein
MTLCVCLNRFVVPVDRRTMPEAPPNWRERRYMTLRNAGNHGTQRAFFR